MKKNLFLIIFLSLFMAQTYAQVVENPNFKSADCSNTIIRKIERTPKFTVVTFEYNNNGAGWVTLNKTMHLQDNHGQDIYKYLKSENIPLLPEKYNFKQPEKLTFKVYFEKLPESVKTVDIIERSISRDESVEFFNFYKVDLNPTQTKVVTEPLQSMKIDSVKTITEKVVSIPVPGGRPETFFNDVTNVISRALNADPDAKATELRNYYNALLKAGFSKKEALKILSSTSK